MTQHLPGKDDHRSVEVLVNAALTETDDDARSNIVAALHWRGTREVLEFAEQLCRSRCPEERRLAADILGQLGTPDRSFPEESAKLLRGLLRDDEDPKVLSEALIGLSFHHDPESASVVVRFARHADAEVRRTVALALSGIESPLAIGTLISLSQDPDADVRDWATFGLGTQLELDTPEIRSALHDRLDDSDEVVRGEALVALARRGDQRVVEALKTELSSEYVDVLMVEAAELIASSELLPYLIDMREWWDLRPELLERAIAACGN